MDTLKIKILYGLVAVLITALLFFVLSEIQDKEWKNPFASEEVIEPPSLLKIAFVNDWEYGYRKRLKHKLTAQAPAELQKAVDFLNNEFKPDIAIGGGDYIESSAVKKETAKIQLREINNIFKTLQAPRLYALGNHDMRSLTKAEVMEILEIPEYHVIQDIGDWRIVVFDTNFNKEDDSDRAEKNYVGGYVSKAELEWLRQALVTDKPVIVFSHHSPYSPPNAKRNSIIQNILNAGEVKAVLEERGNVVASVAGHNTNSYYDEHNGIHYFIDDTMVNEPALGSFATIEFRYVKSKRYAKIDFRQHGIRPASYSVDWQYGQNEKDLLPEEPIVNSPVELEEGED
jgi:hypothetical protein